jgi:hypothetical protein
MPFNRRSFIPGSALLSGSTLGVYGTAIEAADTPHRDGNPTFSDPLLNLPYIDKDEWRDTPVRHRYVHGGFTGALRRPPYPRSILCRALAPCPTSRAPG